MLPSPSNIALRSYTHLSGTQMPAEIAAIKDAIMRGNVDAVREMLNKTVPSPETWQALLTHVFKEGSIPAIKEALLQHSTCPHQAVLELAVRYNDISIARQALKNGADPAHVDALLGTDNMRALLTYIRRRNILYPPHLPDAKVSDLDHALCNVLEDSVKVKAPDLLRQEVQGKNIQQVWRDAVKENRLDIQRAILLLYADRYRRFRLLQEDPVTDEGVVKVMKEIPYFSPKRKSLQNFNCKVDFPGKSEKIECRHLAEHRQAVQEQSDKLKFDYSQFASPKDITDHVSYDTEANHRRLIAHATETHLFHNRDFGKTLVQQLAEMTRKDETTRLLLLTSTGHAMSVGLKIKKKGAPPTYVAELFDPTVTTSHVRVASDSLHTLETLTLKNFIASENLYKNYYREPADLSMMFVRPSPQEQQAMANPAPGVIENRMLTSCIENKKIDATALFHMLRLGFAGDVRRLKDEIASRPEEEQIRLLFAKRADGVPGLFSALESGHADAITAFGELLKLVPPKERAELLAAKSPNGIPGLWKALQNGHADAITAFGELLELVPPEEYAKLLAAKSAKGTPGLFMALQNGHADAIKAFSKLLKQVPPEEHADLLAAKSANGDPGLLIALQNGHVGAVKAFGELLKQVPKEKRADLLAAKGTNGIPGLWKALQNGHADTITAFGELLEHVLPEERGKLLAAKRTLDGMPGFVAALREGHLEALKQYIEIIKRIKPALSPLELDYLFKNFEKILAVHTQE